MSVGEKAQDAPVVSIVLRGGPGGSVVKAMVETLGCPQCSTNNPVDARFCINCGASLTAAVTSPTMGLEGAACPTCSTHNPEHAGFVPCVGSDSLPSLCHVHSRLEQDDYGNVTDRSR